MDSFLAGEVQDRSKQLHSIQRVHSKWVHKPWAPLGGDKSKWLVKLPAMKRQSTSKRLRWMRSMHRNIVDFDDWDDYEDFIEEDDDFLPFDAFGFYGDERMPYEGFCQAVIDEIADYREECGQEKADYGFFKRRWLTTRSRSRPRR